MPLPPEKPPGDTSADTRSARPEGETRALLRILSAQAENANPVVIIAAVALIFTMYDKAGTRGLLVWAALAVAGSVLRFLNSRRVRMQLKESSDEQLQGTLMLTVWSICLSSVVMGSAFWLIAASTKEPYVHMIVTLVSMVHMTAVLLYLMPGVSERLICTAGNLVQGVLFWLGVGTGLEVHWEVLVVYVGLFWCGMVAGREQLRQFRESLRMRDENYALLARLENERATVEGALEAARHANSSKSRFLAAASHDLRQPLHALTMFLGTLGFHINGGDARRLLGRATDTLRVLEEQFNSLLDLSRFDAGVVVANPRAFRLDELLRKVADEFRPQAEGKGLELIVSTVPALAWSDPVLLGRLLRNLLDNAVFYTTSGRVTLRLLKGSGGFSVSVQDTGPGIPSDQQARIFDEYVQLSNPGRKREHGVGLGLAIVKRIDQLLGLNLELRSAAGAGASITIHVQAATGSTEFEPETAVANPLAFRTSARIWILDDDQVVLEGLQAQLEAWGAQVAAFTEPEPMLLALGEAVVQPDWVLTDDMLGGTLCGLDVARIMQREHAGTRVALITGNTEPARLSELRGSGHPVIIKPATPERLIALLCDDADKPLKATSVA